MHIWTMNISQMMTDRTNNSIAPNIMSHVGIQLVYLEFTLTYSEVNLAVGMVTRQICWPSCYHYCSKCLLFLSLLHNIWVASGLLLLLLLLFIESLKFPSHANTPGHW